MMLGCSGPHQQSCGCISDLGLDILRMEYSSYLKRYVDVASRREIGNRYKFSAKIG
jgi:hypothetical protein